MERLDQISKYFSEKERKKLDIKRGSKNGLPDMTPEEIKQSCVENDGYETPELNEKLYLHFRGFKRIQNLEPYTECKALWLDSNGLETIEGLDTLTGLRCLYLSKNLLTRIQGLNSLSELTLLDLANNRLTCIESLSCCPKLQTLNLSRNALSDANSICHLSECPAISTLDVTSNRIDGAGVIEILSRMNSLVALSINGNPITQSSGFRKRMIVAISKMSYLDRPVDEIERIGAKAFSIGGIEAERAAREEYQNNIKAKRSEDIVAFRVWQEEHRKKREAEIKLKLESNGSGVESSEHSTNSNYCSYISDFTPEELAEREREVKLAVDNEKKLLSLGVGRVAQKYWQLDKGNGAHDDVLSAAIEAVEREEESNRSSTSPEEKEEKEGEGRGESLAEEADTDIGGNANEMPETEEEEEEDGKGSLLDMDLDECKPGLHSLATVTEGEKRGVESGGDGPVLQTDVSDGGCSSRGQPEDSRRVKATEPVGDSSGGCAEGETETEVETEDMRREREERVQESLNIFYRQQRARRQAAAQGGGPGAVDRTGGGGANRSNTWGSEATVANPKVEDVGASWPPVVEEGKGVSSDRPLYWTEEMDMALGRLVTELVFDFEAIAVALRGLAVDGTFGRTMQALSFKLTYDSCRVRWGQLDATQWSAVHPQSSALDTVYKVYIEPTVLGKGHGAQPDFSSLAALTAGNMPKYLTPPAYFPSVKDIPDDDEEEENAGELEVK